MTVDGALSALGWTADRQRQLDALADPTLVPARVGVHHRGGYELLGIACSVVELAGRMRHLAGTDQAAAVGDWVAVTLAGTTAIVQQVLPRTSILKRRRPLSPKAQVVAANVDVVFVVTSPGRDLSPRRVERYLAAIHASGARPVVVLNKADAADDLAAALDVLIASAGGAPCVTTSAATGSGMDELLGHLPSGTTGVLVGSSGVGKSTLLNRLLGEARQATATVRHKDDKGRHTTTQRELILVPGAGCLIDTPGMREFGLWEAGVGLSETFSDVEAIAARCRFRDCQHKGEPGCAVAAAVADGTLAEDRRASLGKLRHEQASTERQRDPAAQAHHKAHGKTIHKQKRPRTRVDPKLRDDE